jgi:hypothetical protein
MTRRLGALLRRYGRRSRRVERHARCERCGFAHPLCLVVIDGGLLCRTCQRRLTGGEPFDIHHLGQKPPLITVRVSPNLHVILTFLQGLWQEALEIEPASEEAIIIDLLLFRVLAPLVDGAAR